MSEEISREEIAALLARESMSREAKRCKNCDHFHILFEPLPYHYDAGLAECKKHNLVVDFYNHRKLNKLKCVEEQE